MQEYVETAKKTIISATKKVVNKSAEIYESTKISLKISSLKDDMEGKYKEMGKIIYKKFKGEEVDTDSIEALCAEVDKINAEIEEISQKLAEIKNLSTCPFCGAEVSKTSTYCAKCGEKID